MDDAENAAREEGERWSQARKNPVIALQ